MRAVRWTGRAGEPVHEVPAERCVWCPEPHWMTEADALRYATGAPPTDGMCDAAAKRFLAEAESLTNGHA